MAKGIARRRGASGQQKPTHPCTDEDESFRAALNIEDAVAATGWYGAGGAKLWVTTGTESLHLWEWQAACVEEGGGAAPVPSWNTCGALVLSFSGACAWLREREGAAWRRKSLVDAHVHARTPQTPSTRKTRA